MCVVLVITRVVRSREMKKNYRMHDSARMHDIHMWGMGYAPPISYLTD